MTLTFSVENLEFYLLILVRVSSFVMAAPVFSYSTLPRMVKFAISVFISIIVIQIIPVEPLSYVGVIGYSTLVIKEAAVGVALGYAANLCFYIISFAGQLMDMEMGLSMANLFDPLTNIQTTISGSFYSYMVMLTLVVTNMHYYLIRAIIDSFRYFTVGKAVFGTKVEDVILDFMPNFFIIAFRIILPVFACMLVINIVLGVLSKAAPQMNMFVVGMQLKVLTGIIVMLLIVETIPTVSDFIFTQMKDILSDLIKAFTPT